MSLENMSSQECVVIFAYLNYLQTMNGKQVSKVKHEKPHRPEPVRNRAKNPQYTLEDLIGQESNDDLHDENLKVRPSKPHRPERIRCPLNPPKYTLADMLAQETEDDENGEWDTGGPTGNEIW